MWLNVECKFDLPKYCLILPFIKEHIFMILYIVMFVVSLAVLLFASDKFVEAAERIGLGMGIPSFVIGVTIVAFGTSLPELATSVASVYSGSSEIVLGNVIGSNITNILLILGFTAVIGKGITIDFDIMRTDMPFLLASAGIFYFMIHDFNFTIVEAIISIVALVIFLANSFNTDDHDDAEPIEKTKVRALDWGILLLAAVFIFLGAKYTIMGLENVALQLSVPSHIVAITAVALGTSLPELIVSAAAAKRGQHSIAIGNVLGSNVFNTYIVMGISRFFGDLAIPEDTMDFSFPFMIFVTIMFAFMSFSRTISKFEGWLLLLFYGFFIYVQISNGMIAN